MSYDETDTSPRGYFRGIELASLGQRWHAGVIDYLVPPAIVLGCAIVHHALLGWLTAVAFLLFNNVLYQSYQGCTIGKGFRGLTTFVSKVDINGNPFLAAPSWKRNTARLGLFLALDVGIFLGTGLLRPAVEGWRRCWSDSLTDTFVAAARPRQLKLQASFAAGQVEKFSNKR